MGATVGVSKERLFEVIGYEPHPEQRLYHDSTARFKCAVCGRRFGKSTMAARDLEPELFLPNRRFWIVGPTYDLGEKEFRVIWDDLMIGQKLLDDRRTKWSYNVKQGSMYIEFPWRTRVEVKSAAHPEKLVGDGLHGVIMSEAAKHSWDTFNKYIRPALADYQGWATFPTTPEGYNWVYDLWRNGQDPKQKDEVESWSFPSWKNPYVYPGGYDDPEIQLLKRTMAPDEFEQEIAANFSAFVGKIYGEFNEVEYVNDWVFKPEWPNYITFDWGYVHPLAGIEFQVSPDDRVYIWREHYESYKTIDEHVRVIKDRPNPEGYHLDLAFGDAASPENASYVSSNLVPCWALPEAKQDWYQGIQCVKRFLKKRPDGLPGLLVDRKCANTIKEFNTYKTKENTTASETTARGAVVNLGNDAMDAIRYGLMHLFELGCGQYALSDAMPSNWRETRAEASSLDSGESGVYFSMESMSNL